MAQRCAYARRHRQSRHERLIPLCLIVSSDPGHVAALQRAFKEHRLKLHGVPDLASLPAMLSQWRFDAVLCDAASSSATDVDAAVRWLSHRLRAPVVVLASAGDEDAELSALEAGATGLVPRNASPRVVAVKVQRLIDLAAGAIDDEPRTASLGDLHLDRLRSEAVFRDRVLRLTRGEFELLFLLATRSDRFVQRDAIMRTVGRGATGGESSRCADMHICRIRRKLREAEASSLEVETVYGRGYALRLRLDGTDQPTIFKPSR
jgi:two-component system response regulator RstA